VNERWILPSAILTIASLVLGIALAPVLEMVGAVPLGQALYWLGTYFAYMGSVGFAAIVVLAVRGVPNPTAVIRSFLDRQRTRSLLIGGSLVALNFTAFGFIKPELDRIGFTADSALASIDRFILHADAWQVFAWVRHPFIGETYHALWLGWVFLVLTLLLSQRPSAEKNRALTAYFLLWAIGPLVHLAMPAAGPILYDSLAHSDRFAALAIVPADAQKFNYLLSGYRARGFNPGGGISAMPSLHIATMVWAVRACWRRPVRRTVAIVLAAYMWVASVALGWHYFIDGAAGSLVAILCYALAARLSARPRFRSLSPTSSAGQA
jgi:hypothetical protein